MKQKRHLWYYFIAICIILALLAILFTRVNTSFIAFRLEKSFMSTNITAKNLLMINIIETLNIMMS